jgi:hypothetical protein
VNGRLASLLLLVSCGGPQAPWQQAPPVSLDLKASLSATTVPLFGEVELRLDLFRRGDLEVEFEPRIPEPDFRGAIEKRPPQRLGHGEWQHVVLKLSPVRGPGKLAIPPFRARAKDGTVAATTEELQLEVTTLLAGAEPALEAPGPPFPPRAALWPWLLGGAALLLVILAAAFLRRRQAAPAATVAVPPHVAALRELARLRGSPRRTPAEIDAFYVATSHVLRVYLEQRFGLHAPERTTEEFLLEVEGGGPLSAAQCVELRRFLDQCDLVKFAAWLPAENVHLETLAAAEGLVDQTRADRLPVGISA